MINQNYKFFDLQLFYSYLNTLINSLKSEKSFKIKNEFGL